MLPRESFDFLDERFHKILNDPASLNHILSRKEKNEAWTLEVSTFDPKVEMYGEGERNEKKNKKAMVAAEIPYDGPRVIFGGSNDFGLIKGLGNLVYKGLTIQAVSYVEGLNYNLLSISQFCDKGYSLVFCKDISLKSISTNEVILTGKRIRNIYEVMWENFKEACPISKSGTNKGLSYLNFKTLNKFSKEGLVEGLPKAVYKKESICDACQKGKQVKSSFKAKPAHSTTRILSLIHMDLFGPVTPISLRGNKYVLVVVDDYSRLSVGHVASYAPTLIRVAWARGFGNGIDVERLSPRLLNWSEIRISGEAPSSQVKKGHLKNDYKLLLDMITSCLEYGSGGHVDGITQERAFLLNAFLNKTQVNWAKHFFNSISKHVGQPRQKFLCQGLYIGYMLEFLQVAKSHKDYQERSWMFYMGSKGESKSCSAHEEAASSNEVLTTALKKISKKKQKTSNSSESEDAEEPEDLQQVQIQENLLVQEELDE
ncbi:unnamed protein product [Cuscuta campestris]|uniref:GAG-pre-integrase domain-containing protein n=1 Tax=Cuscuta campestris TaxID=132261 RepID=A0A484KSH3_9ASTE|nr:unnamed protein product [Cuscuta campestris]